MLAIATSIDALAVGITFAFLGVNIVWAIAVIGVTTSSSPWWASPWGMFSARATRRVRQSRAASFSS